MRPAPLTAEQRELLDRLVARHALATSTGRIARHDGDRRAMPLSPAQQRIWFFSRMEEQSVFYNVAGAARLRGRLDPDLLGRCLGEIVERHEVMRSTYHQVDGAPVQCVHPYTGLDLALVDLSSLPAAAREEAVRRRCAEETGRPFDLEHDLMLRPTLLRLSAEEHLLLMVQHHIATDGWAMNVLIRELGERYSARTEGREPRLPDLTVQYGDFAVWQREWLDGPEVRDQLDHWRERLADTRLVDVATGLPRSAALTWRGGAIAYRLEPEVVRRLTALAEAERATPFMALLAAQSLVLSRWSGQEDIIIGSAVAGRRRAEIEHLTGCFVNELVLRMDTSGSPSYRELLRQAREVSLGAYENQDVPFERIVEAITPERDNRARVPLVRHQMGFDNSPRWSARLGDLTCTIEPLSTHTARFDLEVDLEPDDDGGVRGTVYFSTDVFTEDTVRRMLDSLTTVIDTVCEAPDVPVRELPVVGPGELARLDGISGPAAPLPATTVNALVERWARERPGDTAVRHGDETLDRGELDARANRLSWQLGELGVAAGQPVAVCLPPSSRLVVALLGVLKAGALAVPIDPAAPVRDLDDVLLDCSAAVVLTDGPGPDGLDPMVLAFDMATDLSRWPADRPAVAPGPGQGAFVNYPGAVDGPARGTVNTHAGVAHRLLRAAALHLEGVDTGTGHGVLTVPRGFDLGPWELLWPLVAGVPLVLPVDGTAEALAATVRSVPVAVLGCTPSTLHELLDTDPELPALRRVVCAGERPWPALVARLRAAARDSELQLRSGPAHMALDVIVQTVGDTVEPGALSPLGAPAPGAGLWVLDEAGLPVPGSVPGELCVGGVPLPSGVLGRPQELERLLVDDPLTAGRKLLRTGLRARVLPDGSVEALGRDIRIRTHQVEPTDVESVLHATREVERALVGVRTDGDTGPELVAHVALGPDDGRGGKELRAAFEETYGGRAAEDDPALGITGWNSPHTGEYLTGAEMREWADTTLRRVRSLGPSDVLEIGCRTGSLLFRLAPRCATYTATDLSAVALRHIREHQDWLATKAEDVSLLQRAADDFDGLPEHGFDTVVLNAVTQYFPGAAYLESVLSGALRVLRPGGHVYLGSVRSLPLAEALHLPGRLEALAPEADARQLRRALAARVGQEEELLLDPEYFTGLAGRLDGLAEVYVLPRTGRHRNELSAYCYDVVLRAGAPVACGTPTDTLDWVSDGLTAETLTRHLHEHAPERLLVTSVPDARVHGRLAALEHAGRGPATVAEVTSALAPRPAAPGGPVDPTALTTAAEAAGYPALVQCGAAPGSLQLLLGPRAERPDAEEGAERAEAPLPGFGRRPGARGEGHRPVVNDPGSVARARRVVARLHHRLQDRLPAPAVPSHIIVVPGFAADRTGVVRRDALPGPDPSIDPAQPHQEPSTPTETAVAAIWSEALGRDRVGVHDDFFALGGHSLLGSEVMDRVRRQYEVNVPLSLLFESPTVSAVARYLDELLAKPRAASVPAIRRIDRSALRRPRPAEPAESAPSKENQ
ncbi:condensation domain-containing protein [Streptomyces anulatus]|uniref:non-ribosomal peptide synthetase n=1 Tax=Streptomyces anulatus TaxID=1892 RepID=UPI0033FA75D4